MDKRIHIDQIGQLVELREDIPSGTACEDCIYYNMQPCHKVSPLTDSCDYSTMWALVVTDG